MNLNNLSKFVIASVAFSAFAVASAAPVAPALKSQDMMNDSMMMNSSKFKGIEVNKGTVSAKVTDKGIVLMLSKDFTLPKTPAPHWQIVDSKGNTYLLKQLKIAGNKMNRMVTVPSYVADVKSVQIWCSFAEVNLGEATFSKAISR
jgi:hypothetical protein